MTSEGNGGIVEQPDDMTEERYPALFRSSDAASIKAQGRYLWFQRVHLGSLVFGGVIGACTMFPQNPLNVWLYCVTAIILAVGLALLWVTRSKQYDKAWFDCRAIAESVKTATWRFMMHTPPFQVDDSVEYQFVSELREIRQARPSCEVYLAGVMNADASAITGFMRHIRSLPFDRRRNLYLKCRLCDQKSWYSHKAKASARHGAQWFWMAFALQAIAVTVAIIQAVAGGLAFNVVPILTTCAAAAAAWNQMKRHDELTKTYALAAQELGELESIAGGLTCESDFPKLVEQVEEAISREHTMWCARRDVLLAGHEQCR